MELYRPSTAVFVHVVLFLIVFFFPMVSNAQTIEQADSVYQDLLIHPEDTTRMLDFNRFLNRFLDSEADSCLIYGERLYALAEKVGFYRAMALALNIQGVALERKDYEEAIRKYDACVEISLQHNLRTILSSAYNNLSIVYSYMGLYEISLEYLVKTLQMAEEMNDSSRMAVVLNNIGLRYYELSNPSQALNYFFQAMRLNEQLGTDDWMAINYGNIGNAYFLMDQYDTAIYYYQEAIEFHEQKNTRYYLLTNYQSMVYPLIRKKDYALAREYLDKAWKLLDETEDPYGMANAHLLEANLLRSRGKFSQAIEQANRSVSMARGINATMLLVDAYEVLSEIYAGLKNYEKALIFKDKAGSIRDSIHNQVKDKALGKVTAYEREKRDKEIKILEKESEIQKLKIKRQKLLRNSLIGFGAMLLIVAVGLWQRYRYIRQTKNRLAEQNAIIEKEKERSDELLLNILPAETAAELKMKGKSEARHYDPVTVLFTDFKGFTQIAEKLSPTELVEEIDHCYQEFDRIISRHGVEKIKTIGDAYMCAGGLPVPNTTHPQDVVRAALDIQQFMQRLKENRIKEGHPYFEVRIGIHTGPVVAGIVGIKKFAYDIWGDTVNIAARMESSGEVGKINISQDTYEKVRHRFHCRPRGKIQAKGKGEIEMYFVEAEN